MSLTQEFKGYVWGIAPGVHIDIVLTPPPTPPPGSRDGTDQLSPPPRLSAQRGTVLVHDFGFPSPSQPCDDEAQPTPLPLIFSGDDVHGYVDMLTEFGETFTYTAAVVELIGTVSLRFDVTGEENVVARWTHTFPPSTPTAKREETFTGRRRLPFSFTNVSVDHDSYRGRYIHMRYYLRVCLTRSWVPDVEHERDLWLLCAPQAMATRERMAVQQNVRLEVGIEKLLHLEMEYDRSTYYTDDVVLGKIYFLSLSVGLKSMTLSLQRREVITIHGSAFVESEDVLEFEVMDGAPSVDECIPLRMHLAAAPTLTPTTRNAFGLFSVVYFLNLLLVDEADRKYFKSNEITLV
eukprot:PhM_4_TR12567/c0_g1_i1/m.61738/K18466/VPS26; vacuolar protein sorting-associated protein 26